MTVYFYYFPKVKGVQIYVPAATNKSRCQNKKNLTRSRYKIVLSRRKLSLLALFGENDPRFLKSFPVIELLRFLHVHTNRMSFIRKILMHCRINVLSSHHHNNGWSLDSQIDYCRELKLYLRWQKSKRTYSKYFIQNNTETPPERNNNNNNKMRITIARHILNLSSLKFSDLESESSNLPEARFLLSSPELAFLALRTLRANWLAVVSLVLDGTDILLPWLKVPLTGLL